MPSGTLPAAGSLGDSEISTGDYQTQINQLLAYVRSLQSEVSALSGTEIKEGAVRGVGTASGELVDTSRLDTRLGTSGNLGTAATKNIVNLIAQEIAGSYRVNAGLRAGPLSGLGSIDIDRSIMSLEAQCLTDSSVKIVPHSYDVPPGLCSIYFITNGSGSYEVEIFNNTAQNLDFNVNWIYLEL